MQVTPQVMQMLSGLLEREVTRDDPEWAAAMALLTVSEKVRIMPSRRQHKENERDCRMVAQQLKPSIPQSGLMMTSSNQKEQEIGTQKKLSLLRIPIRNGENLKKTRSKKVLSRKKDVEESCLVNEQNSEQENLSGEMAVEENGCVEEQDMDDITLSGEFRWMSRTYRCSEADSSVENKTRNSEIYTYSDRISSTGSEL